MTTALTIASLAAFILLTLGTAIFVAAEFSLTALERSAKLLGLNLKDHL